MSQSDTNSQNVQAASDAASDSGIKSAAQNAGAKASEAVSSLKAEAAPMMENMQTRTSEVVEAAHEQVGQLSGQAQETVKTKLEEGKERAATTLSSVAEALRETGQSLEQKEGAYVDTLGSYTQRASEQISRLTEHLQNSDVDQLLHETEEFARRDPALFLGAAFTIGVLGARFLKSSSRHSHSSYDHSSYRGTYNSSTQDTRALPPAVTDGLAGASVNAPRNTAVATSGSPFTPENKEGVAWRNP